MTERLMKRDGVEGIVNEMRDKVAKFAAVLCVLDRKIREAEVGSHFSMEEVLGLILEAQKEVDFVSAIREDEHNEPADQH